jgi:hypothetical protein
MNDWIVWEGGECQVPKGARVEVRFRVDDEGGTDTVNIMTELDYDGLRWTHTGSIGDIVAYRLLDAAPGEPEMLLKPSQRPIILPADPAERSGLPITTGVIDYFPRALAEVARVSKAGNDQHNPGQPLHWSKDKSTDHADCIPRHLIDRFTRDADGQRHAAKMAWRSLAFLETLLEDEAAADRSTNHA